MRFYLMLILSVPLTLFGSSFMPGPAPSRISCAAPTPAVLTAQIAAEHKQELYDDAEETASRVLQRHCGDDEYAELIAHSAIDNKLPVRVVSSLIVVESTCRPGVVSSEGAVGLMQVVPRVWHVPAEQLKDPETNIRKGTEILASYTRAHGLVEGLHRYNGLGVGCAACDGDYGNKVLTIAGGVRQ